MGAQVRIAKLLHADEASENLSEGLKNKIINLTNKSTITNFKDWSSDSLFFKA